MLGSLDSSGKFTDTIPKLLDNVGLQLKTLIQSESKDLEANKRLSGCALGYLWEPSTDFMGIKFNFNPFKICKGVNVKPNLAISDLDNFKESILSKRLVLSLCKVIYDPIGMATPYTIELNLQMRETLFQKDRSESNKRDLWDSPILQDFVLKWTSHIKE